MQIKLLILIGLNLFVATTASADEFETDRFYRSAITFYQIDALNPWTPFKMIESSEANCSCGKL